MAFKQSFNENPDYQCRSRDRQLWLESLPMFKEYAQPGEQFLPPMDDAQCCAFMDDILWKASNNFPESCLRFYPRDKVGDRPLLKRVYKKHAMDGSPNPSYGRFYFVNRDPSGPKYFQWLDDTVWYKSYCHRRCLNMDWQRLISCMGQPIDVPLWEPLFFKYYNLEKSVDDIVRDSFPAKTPAVVSSPRTPTNGTSLPPLGPVPRRQLFGGGSGRAAVEQFQDGRRV
jgi:hypothetical protein